MQDNQKTKAQLITELRELRERAAKLEEGQRLQRDLSPFNLFAETASSAIVIFQDSMFRYVNPAGLKLTGYTAEELLGTNVWNLVHPEHRDLIRERADAWRRGESVPHRSEFKILTRTGETRWVDVDSTFIEFEGKPAALAIAFDSTEHKRAEEALSDSEQRYRKITETTQEAIWMVDAEAKTTYVNENLAEMLGYTRDELLGRSVCDFVHEADRAQTRRYLEHGRSGVKEQHDFRFRRKDGGERWALVSTTPLFDGPGAFAGGLAMLIDITDRKRDEEALRESEAKFRVLAQTIASLIVIFQDSRIVYANPYAESFTGYSRSELLSMDFWEIIHPDHQGWVKERGLARLRGDNVNPRYEVKIVDKKGETRWLDFSACSLEFEGKASVLGTAFDITERKRAEEALLESEAKFRALAQTAPAGIFIFQDSKIVYANAYAETHSGYSEEDLRSMDFWKLIHPDHRQNVREQARARLRGDAVPSHYEVKLVSRDGEERWVDFSATSLEFEGKPSVLGAVCDITERKRVEEALRESENRFRTLAETASDAIITMDDSGRIAFVNQAAEKVFGYTQQEMLDSELTKLMPEGRRTLHQAAFKRYRETGKRSMGWEAIELLGLHKNGNEIPLELSFGEFIQDDKRFVTGIARDITDRKRANEALRKTQARLQHVLSFSPAIIYLLHVKDGKFIPEWVSESLTRVTGHELPDALGERWWADNLHPDDRARVLAKLPRLLTEDRLALEYRFRHTDGGYLWLHNESRLLRDQSGNPVEVIGSWVDVTERREAEGALRESEERFRTLVSSMDDMVFTVDLHRRHTGAFGRWIEKLGIERRDLIGSTASEIFGVDSASTHDQAYARGLAGEQVVYEWSMALEGETRHFQTSLSPIRDQDGKVTGLVGVGRDNTERKRAGEALRASEERYRELVENARDIIYSHDLTGNYISVNRAGEQITGYTREESLRMNLTQTVAPEYLDRARQMITSKLDGQKETVYDLEVIAKDGHRIKVEVNTRLVYQDGVPVAVQGIARDVTERKRAEEALRDSQERFKRYFELGLIGMSISSSTGGYLEVNDHLCEMLGYERSELLNRMWSEFTHPDDLEVNVLNFNRVLAGESDGYSMEKRFIRKDGDVVYSLISVKCVRNASGAVDYFVALTQDITNRKQAEQALRESQSQLKAILDNCPSMIFLKDLDGHYLQVNEQFERTFNMTAEEVLGRTDWEVFPKQMADIFRATDCAVLESGRMLEFEESALYDDGPHTYIVHKFPVNDMSAVPYAVGGISTDITGRKQAENDLRRQKEILQKIFDHIPIFIALFDEEGRFKLVNREFERTMGWSLKDIETKTKDIFAEFYPDPQDRKDVQDFIAESNAEWSDFKTTVKDGQVIDTSWANVVLSDGSNIGIGRDISDRKRADDLLRRQTAQLAALHDIGLEISGESELSRVFDVAKHRTAELLNANHCSIHLREQEKNELNLVASLDDDPVGLSVNEGQALAGGVAISRDAQPIDDYSQWIDRASLVPDKGFGPSLGAPLKCQNTVIGAISLWREKGSEPFTNADLDFLKQIAAEVAIAIHQTSLFEEVQEGQRRLQVLSHRLIDGQEAERKRLARELHDQIGQALTAVQISLQTLQISTTESVAKFLEDSLALVDEAIQQVHDLSLDLRPSLLDDLGLVAALRWYVGRVAGRAGLEHGFKADGLDKRLAPEVETACFRIAQEAITNVLRHASATNVSVEITSGNSNLCLLVRDDGIGFDVRTAMGRTGLTASLGLQGMQERAAAIGGSVDIRSKLRRGTKVQATLLLERIPS